MGVRRDGRPFTPMIRNGVVTGVQGFITSDQVFIDQSRSTVTVGDQNFVMVEKPVDIDKFVYGWKTGTCDLCRKKDCSTIRVDDDVWFCSDCSTGMPCGPEKKLAVASRPSLLVRILRKIDDMFDQTFHSRRPRRHRRRHL